MERSSYAAIISTLLLTFFVGSASAQELELPAGTSMTDGPSEMKCPPGFEWTGDLNYPCHDTASGPDDSPAHVSITMDGLCPDEESDRYRYMADYVLDNSASDVETLFMLYWPDFGWAPTYVPAGEITYLWEVMLYSPLEVFITANGITVFDGVIEGPVFDCIEDEIDTSDDAVTIEGDQEEIIPNEEDDPPVVAPARTEAATITAPAATTQLPITGTDPWIYLLVGVGALFLGAAILLPTRH